MTARNPALSHLSDVDIMEQLAIYEARESFWAFRQYMNPKMKLAWWQREVCYALQQFYEDMLNSKRPKLVIEAPPQHGKSETIVDFIAWMSGRDPDLKTIYASFSGRLGKRANKRLQKMFKTRTFNLIFPDLKLNITRNKNDADGSASLSQELVEFKGREGSFRNTTVGGAITGESLSLGVIDDPMKGRETANSETIRDKTWDWFTDDFFTRFSENAGLLCILTRWHLDDPIGRFRLLFPETKVMRYQAIATEDEPNRKAGEALMPEHKSLEFLLERKRAMGTANFEALYQQNPIILGGEIIKGKWFHRAERPPKILYRKIYGDTAMKTEERHDYSVFECWGYGEDKKIYMLDVMRGKWEAPELKRAAVDFWNKHRDPQRYDPAIWGACREMVIEDKASGTGLIQELKRTVGIPIKPQERVKDKLTRVLDVVSWIEAGFVCILDGASYVHDFITECEAFTADDSHANDDQIDPMCDAIVDMLATGPRSFFLS